MPKRNFNVNSLTLSDLLDLRGEVDRALRDKIESEQGALRQRMDELSSLQGVSAPRKVAANGPARPARRSGARPNPLKGRKVTPKYRGPDGQTWSGRGLPPRWLSELERKGKKRESFLIESSK